MEKQKLLYQQARLHERGAAEMVLQTISASKGRFPTRCPAAHILYWQYSHCSLNRTGFLQRNSWSSCFLLEIDVLGNEREFRTVFVNNSVIVCT